jgi:pimeloyl-ACP methyl ester carboxylesterase
MGAIMRKRVLIFVLLTIVSTQAFIPAQQPGGTTLTILNRKNQATTQITDGDTIQIQVVLGQPAARQESLSFLFGDTTVGSCTIPNGDTTCKTDWFPSLGWHWNGNGMPRDTDLLQVANDRGEVLVQSRISVKPRPVVLVHGFISNWQTWKAYLQPDGFLASIGLQGFAIGDGQVPGTMNTGQITDPASHTNTIAQNAEILGQYIASVKKQTGAEMMDLVVHSMGGLISRYYIDRVMKERDVAQLIMLGSPMGGSDCSVLPAALGFFLPASIEIRESYMRGVFNQQITHRKGIEFYDLGGTAIKDSFKSPCTEIPNDTVVSFESINAILLQSSKIDDIHSDLTISQKAFTDFVEPLLEKPVGSFVAQPDPAPTAQAESPLDFTRVYTGHVDQGGSTELMINIEPGIAVAAFALYDASRSVTTVVRGVSGNVIQLNAETNGFIRIDDPSSLLYLGYGFQNPRPGHWKVTVQATESTPAGGTDFAISVYFVGGAKLESASSTLVPQLNETVTLTANISLNGEPLQITQAQAIIKHPDGKTETVDFPAGQNVSSTWTPRQAGTHAVDIVVTALAPDGSSLERTDFLAIEVQSNFSQGQITFNLILLIAFILCFVALILYLAIRGTGLFLRRIRP